MAWWTVGLPLILLAIPLAGVLIVYLVALHRPNERVLVEVWRWGRWIEELAFVHYRHWLPRAMRVSGLSIGRHIWLRHGKPQGPGVPATQRHQAAHEFAHYYDWIVNPDAAVFVSHLAGIAQHLGNHDARPREQMAIRRQRAITNGTSAFVRFPGNWLMYAFPDNYGDPHDPITERRRVDRGVKVAA